MAPRANYNSVRFWKSAQRLVVTALAASLNNLSNRLADLGRPAEALAAIEEAVGIRRSLAEANPAASLPELVPWPYTFAPSSGVKSDT